MRRSGLVVVCIAILVSLAAPSTASADGPNRAGIVISFDDGRSESVCVDFTEAEISGAELLSRAGFSVVASSAWGGGATCMIDGVGCANPNDCWCGCHGAPCRYWAYSTMENGEWRYSAVGALQRKVHDGDVDGWAWGAGGIGTGAQPEARSFDEVCPPLAPTPPPTTPTPVPAVESVATQPGVTATVVRATPRVDPASVVAVSTSTAAPSPSATSTIAPASGGGIGSRPTWQIALFAAVASALAMTSLILFRGRGSG